MHLLAPLRDRGLTVEAAGDRLRVSPADKLDDELRQYIRQHKSALLDLARQWTELEAAAHACCDARGDTAENRAALLADCWQEPADSWAWWRDYFTTEAAKATH